MRHLNNMEVAVLSNIESFNKHMVKTDGKIIDVTCVHDMVRVWIVKETGEQEFTQSSKMIVREEIDFWILNHNLMDFVSQKD